jgi:hypothetical protein
MRDALAVDSTKSKVDSGVEFDSQFGLGWGRRHGSFRHVRALSSRLLRTMTVSLPCRRATDRLFFFQNRRKICY